MRLGNGGRVVAWENSGLDIMPSNPNAYSTSSTDFFFVVTPHS